MPITNYECHDRVFFAKETGFVTTEEAYVWVEKLESCASQNQQPIVALVDALEVTRISPVAYQVFSKASFTENVVGVVVATNAVITQTSTTISRLGKRQQTWVFSTLDEARQYALRLLEENPEYDSPDQAE